MVTKVKVYFTIPPPYLSVEEFIFEERGFNTSKIPKIGSKLPGYEGGGLTIHNVDGGGNALEVDDM